MEEAIYRQVVVVADDEVMLEIEGRDAIEPVIVIRINLFLDARCLVIRFGVGIAGEEGERSGGVLEGDLQTVVLRIAHVLVVGIGTNRVGKGAARSVNHRTVRAGIDQVLPKGAASRRA